MQLVPIIPQPEVGVKESLEVTGVAALKPAKPVMERTLPPGATYAHEKSAQTPAEGAQHKVHMIARRGERRLVCRRSQHQDILQELRSAVDRRRKQLRKTDLPLHVDEQA